MPINYNDKNYNQLTFNWEKIFLELKSVRLFNNVKINALFFDTWKKKLVLSDKEAKINFESSHFRNTEHYPLPLYFDELLLGNVAINISACEKKIYTEQLLPTQLEVNYFMDINEFVKLSVPPYTSKHVITYNYSLINPFFSYIPILIFDSQYTNHSTTIDGNHRVSSLTLSNERLINCNIVNASFFSDRELFMDNYSFYMFSFWKEFHFFYFNNKMRSFLSRFLISEKNFLNSYSQFVKI